MGSSDNEITVLFADIVGSTRLYEILGDQTAEGLISKTLKKLGGFVTAAEGEIVKTIGDELMCRFPEADQAVTAARQMHEYLAKKPAASPDYKISIRVGAHHGPIIENDGDVFGDTVNIAARVAELARGGKTMVTGYTHKRLADSTRKRCRHFTRTTVKGKEQPIDVYDVVWEQTDELTRVVGNRDSSAIGNILILELDGTVIRLSASTKTIASLGRSQDCDLVVSSEHASREHCRIECNRGKFVLNDNSANGSFVTHHETELFFHQEHVPLLGEGHISLGIPAASNPRFLIRYSIELTDNDDQK